MWKVFGMNIFELLDFFFFLISNNFGKNNN